LPNSVGQGDVQIADNGKFKLEFHHSSLETY
jgi:hypothetical protein